MKLVFITKIIKMHSQQNIKFLLQSELLTNKLHEAESFLEKLIVP
jgi:hypothetical protein